MASRAPNRSLSWAAAALLVVGACSSTTGPRSGPSPAATTPGGAGTTGPESSAPPSPDADAAPAALIYLKGRALYSYDLDSGAATRLNAVPGPDVALSPDGTRYAAVEETSPAGPGPEGFRAPVITLASVGDPAPTIVGPGESPVWSPDSRRIAALDAPDCPSPGEGGPATPCRLPSVVAYRARAAPHRGRPIARGATAILAWTSTTSIATARGDAVVISDVGGGEGFAFRPAPGLWGVWGSDSSAVLRLLIQGPHGAATLEVAPTNSQAQIAGPVIDVDLGEGRLGEGAWSPDGDMIAVIAVTAVLLSGSARSGLVAIDAASGRATPVPQGRHAQGQVVWSADSSRFAFSRVDPDHPLDLQAVVCSADLACDPAFSWGRGVYLLGFAS